MNASEVTSSFIKTAALDMDCSLMGSLMRIIDKSKNKRAVSIHSHDKSKNMPTQSTVDNVFNIAR